MEVREARWSYGEKAQTGPWRRHANAGSFDCVRLTPHFAQDDRLEVDGALLAVRLSTAGIPPGVAYDRGNAMLARYLPLMVPLKIVPVI
jgi:hypothetical protein